MSREFTSSSLEEINGMLSADFTFEEIQRTLDNPELNTYLIDGVRTSTMFPSYRADRKPCDIAQRAHYLHYAKGEAAIAAYRQFFQILLGHDGGSLLFHCRMGKDRTGIGAALLLSALGVPRATVERDYLYSNAMLAGMIERSVSQIVNQTADEEIVRCARMVMGVDEGLYHCYWNAVEAEYGSIEAYLTNVMELGKEQIAVLREKYTQKVK